MTAMTIRRTAAALALGGAAVLLAGCGSDSDPVAVDPGTQSTAPTDVPAATDTPTPTPNEPSSAPAGSDLITLEAPADGATVSGKLAASGMANSPEANVPWKITDSTGKAVLDGAFTATGWMDKLYPYKGSVDVSSLAPGTYTFTVAVDDESDGEGTPAPSVSHTITVS